MCRGLRMEARREARAEDAAADPARRGVVAWATVSGVPAVLEALLIGLVTSQISFIVTTVYLHRALAHKAITLRPSVAFVVPHHHLDVHGDPASSMGGGAPQAPRPHRQGGRPAFARDLRLLAGPVRQRRALPEGLQESRAGGPLRQGSPRGPLGQGALQPRAAGPGARHRPPGRRVRLGDRADRGSGPRLHLPAGRRCHQRDRAQVGQAAARQPGHEQPVAGLVGRRRGSAQQPPRPHHLQPDVGGQGRDRPRLVGHQGARQAPLGHACGTRSWPSSQPGPDPPSGALRELRRASWCHDRGPADARRARAGAPRATRR